MVIVEDLWKCDCRICTTPSDDVPVFFLFFSLVSIIIALESSRLDDLALVAMAYPWLCGNNAE
jgi:hypothetical protein